MDFGRTLYRELVLGSEWTPEEPITGAWLGIINREPLAMRDLRPRVKQPKPEPPTKPPKPTQLSLF